MRELTRRKADGDLARPAHLRPRAVPPRGRPALAGADRRAPRRPGAEVARDALAAEPRRRRATAHPLLAAVDLVQVLRLDARAAGRVARAARPVRSSPSWARPGSGKSTLLHCLAGIVRPDGGAGRATAARTSAACPTRARSALRRSDFGFVFQFGQLVPELTCLENVALPLRLAGLRRGAAAERARGLAGAARGRGRGRPAARARCPADRRSGSPSRAPWSPTRGSSSPTSRPARSTRSTASA